MATVNAFFNSSTASTSLMKAFMAQSKASVLQNLSFFNGRESTDLVDISQIAMQSSMFASIMQGGNSAVFGSLYDDAEAFNQSLMTSVAATAGFNFDTSNSFLGQLINQLG
jgi:hypothetical protein